MVDPVEAQHYRLERCIARARPQTRGQLLEFSRQTFAELLP
jgi:hypothetical protein